MKRILLADDHSIVLDGLAALVSTVPDWEITGRCVNGREVLDAVGDEQPDLLIMDVGMPVMDGLEAVRRMKGKGDLPPTIVLAASLSDTQVREAVRLGVWGVVMKEQVSGIIIDCAHAALEGEPWVPSPSQARALGLDAAGGRSSPHSDEELTEREIEVAWCIADGLSNTATAFRLDIAEGTVKTHLHRIYRKMGVRNRVELALLWRERN